MLEANIDGRRTRRSPVPDEKAPPAGPPTTSGPVEVDDRQAAAAVELLVVGPPVALPSLPQQLPAVWQVRWASTDEQAGEVDIVLLADADAGCVTDLLGRHPELVVLAAVARDAPASHSRRRAQGRRHGLRAGQRTARRCRRRRRPPACLQPLPHEPATGNRQPGDRPPVRG